MRDRAPTLARENLGSATAVKVRDTLRALGDLAHFRREQFGPKVLAITGSNGKTTTKEMVAAILEEASLEVESLRGKGFEDGRQFQQSGGPALDLLRLRKRDKVAVVELGTNRPGEIDRLARDRRAGFGHHYLGGRRPSRRAEQFGRSGAGKGRAVPRRPRAAGAIAVNLDDPRVQASGRKIQRQENHLWQARPGARASRSICWLPRGDRFTLRAGRQRGNVRLNYLGQHNIANALGAAALASAPA